MLLTELLTPARVRVPLAARDKHGLLRELATLAAAATGAGADELLAAVESREAVLSTGIGFGVAIPHGRCATVRGVALVGGVSAVPIAYDSIDGEPVRIALLIVGPESAASQHVQLLSRIARLLRSDAVRGRLIAARNAEEFLSAIAQAEAS